MSVGPVSLSGSSAWAAGSLPTRPYLRQCGMGPAKRLILMTRVQCAGKGVPCLGQLVHVTAGVRAERPALIPQSAAPVTG